MIIEKQTSHRKSES